MLRASRRSPKSQVEVQPSTASLHTRHLPSDVQSSRAMHAGPSHALAPLELSHVYCTCFVRRSAVDDLLRSTCDSRSTADGLSSCPLADDASSKLSQLMAIMTLSPILVVPAYLAVFVFERELVVLNMLAGQLVNELLSWVLKRHLKEERPYRQSRRKGRC